MDIISFDASKKGITKNAFLGFIFQFLIKFKGVIILPLIVHFLPKSVIREWRLISSSVAIILPVITLNILDGSGMFFSGDTEKRRVRIKYYSVVNYTLIVAVVIGIVAVFIQSTIPMLQRYTVILLLYFNSLIFVKLSSFLYQTYQKSQKLLLINLIVEYGGATLTLLLLIFGMKNIYSLIVPITFLNFIV